MSLIIRMEKWIHWIQRRSHLKRKHSDLLDTVLLSTSSSSLSLSHLGSSIFWKITIIVNDRLFLHMTTLRDDEYFMSSILCNPGSKKNHSFLKVVSYFWIQLKSISFFKNFKYNGFRPNSDELYIKHDRA